jgi:hypothetical protein
MENERRQSDHKQRRERVNELPFSAHVSCMSSKVR